MVKSLPFRSAIASIIFLCVALSSQAQQAFFEPTSRARAAADDKPIRNALAYRLRDTDLRQHLAKAPREFSAGAAIELAIPLPDGTTETFLIRESAVLAPSVAARHADIKTYTGVGKVHGDYTLTVTYTSSGFDAIVLGVDGDAVYVTKTSTNPTDRTYLTYFARDVRKLNSVRAFGSGKDRCVPLGKTAPIDLSAPADQQGRKGARNNTGTSLRTFRLAVAATGEFTTQKGSGNVTTAFNALVGYVNRMNAVYRRELSVAFTLVSTDNVVYPNPATDPFTNTNQSTMLGENQTTLDNVVGTANYDVGHVFSYEGGSGGGLAAAPSVCVAGSKAQGVSGMGDPAQFAPIFDDQLVTHEVGHQFSMSHSFNSNIPVCTTRELATSVEPGAGQTIMSYGFTCSGDDYEPGLGVNSAPILNFHTANYQQAVTYINTISCFTSSALANNVPVIANFPANVTIPKSTPFELSATASDADGGDVLNYSWEGTNISTIPANANVTAAILADASQPPFFRSYAPVAVGKRTFPRLDAILNGSNQVKGDKLPSVGMATTIRLTVRDGVGGLTYQQVTVTTDGGSGPFLVTSNLTGSLVGNTAQTVTWSVNNTDQAPVSCANVDILLSTDGGQTFPTTLLANAPNNGSASVTLPNVATTQARLKVKASNSIFFDISNSDFTITQNLPVELVAFRAEAAVNQVRLSWQTATERNSDRFVVERSQDLGEFLAVGTVSAAGESNSLRSYGLNDEQPLLGTSYYRLRQTDRDGRTQLSKAVAVRLDPQAPLLLVTPNPVSPTQVRYRLFNMDVPTMSLLTVAGKAIPVQSVTSEGNGTYLLRLATPLPTGTYLLRAESGAKQLSQRVLVAD